LFYKDIVDFFNENNYYDDYFDRDYEPPVYSEGEKIERKKKFFEYVKNHNDSQSKL